MDEHITCGPLRIVFFRHGDRFAHRIEELHGDAFVPVLESLEGTESDSWPESPPFQSLHFEQKTNGRRVALLVGMAGRSHWSASVEADTAAERIVFDIACRVHEQPAWLGSTYRVGKASASVSVARESDFASLTETADRLIVCPTVTVEGLPCTVRWQYAISAK